MSMWMERALRWLKMALPKGFKLWKPIDEDSFIIAYGSNLSEERMKSRCPSAEVYGTSVIHGYRMLFKQSMTGAYATIEQDADSQIPVVIYRVTAEDEARMDRFEGCPRYYRKQEFLLPVWARNGRKRKSRSSCVAYIMHEHRVLGEPPVDYYSLLDQGYSRWGFDHEILVRALESSIGRKHAAIWLRNYNKAEENDHE